MGSVVFIAGLATPDGHATMVNPDRDASDRAAKGEQRGLRGEAFDTGPWLDGIRARHGMDPQIKFFETACITDNAMEAVLLPAAAE